MPAEITAILIDDHQLVLDGLSRALAREGLRVVGSFLAAPEALSYVAENPVDFAVVDLRLCGDSGVRVVGEIRKMRPRTRVAVLTSYDDRSAAAAAVRAGATEIGRASCRERVESSRGGGTM